MTGELVRRLVRRYVIAGLLVWVPIVVTVLVVRFILDLMDQTLLLLPAAARPEALFGFHIPGLGLLLALLLLISTGVLVSNIIGRSLVGLWEDLMNRIPFVRALYSGVKSFSETVFSKSGSSFKSVLLVEYPRAGLWSMGFQTTDHLEEISERLGEPQVCVFIPTTPNPTSGFIFFVPRSKCIELDMSIDNAMKMIVTLGVVGPGHALHPGAHPAAGTTTTGSRS